MTQYEYKVVPAPKRGLKAKGVKGSEARFAHALQTVMNTEGAEGWEYQRTDTLPSEERQGLTGRTTVFQNMLVFRREIVEAVPEAPIEAPALIEDQSEELAAEEHVAEAEVEETEEVSAEDRVHDTLNAGQHDTPSDTLAEHGANSDDSPRTHAAE